MSGDVRELIAEVHELISEFEAIWGTGKRSENLRVMGRLADALEATLQPITITDEMVEKMAKELYVIFGEYDERQWRDASFVVKQTWRTCARAALEVALGGGGEPYCHQCDYDTHVCPGCGDNLNHGQNACAECTERVRVDALADVIEGAITQHREDEEAFALEGYEDDLPPINRRHFVARAVAEWFEKQ